MSEELSIQGTLAETTVPDLFRSLIRSSETAIVSLEGLGRTDVIYVYEGKIIFASSTDPDMGPKLRDADTRLRIVGPHSYWSPSPSPFYVSLADRCRRLGGIDLSGPTYVDEELAAIYRGATVSVACLLTPLEVTAIVAAVACVTAAVVTGIDADHEPAGTVKVAGTPTAGLSLDRLSTTPPAGAGPCRSTQAVAGEPPLTAAGVSWSDFSPAGSTVLQPLDSLLP